MPGTPAVVVIGLDVGGTKTNATVLSEDGRFLVDNMLEVPSRVLDGPAAAIEAIDESMGVALAVTATPRHAARAVGLDTPGPASATGVISARGATNFADTEWWGFDVRTAVEDRLGLPVIYNNDGNAAALYAHELHFGDTASRHSSISAIVGTGLGGGVIEAGQVVRGAAGMAGELGHVHIPMDGLLVAGQPVPRCNCGFSADLESVASLSGIANNLLPFWLTRYPDHPLREVEIGVAAKLVREYGERGDEMALRIFEQQATAIGRMFTIAANFTDPDVYFVGGGVTDAGVEFRTWFVERVRAATQLRDEQAKLATFAIVPDLDMAGARGSALAALRAIRPSDRAQYIERFAKEVRAMAEQSPPSRRDVEARLTAKAWKDAVFAEALRTDPKAAVERELGRSLPADVTVTVLEETPTRLYLVIPAKPAGPEGEALSDSELEVVAGGSGGLMQLVAYGFPESK